jgi:uncharacterized protein YjbI with pentapeptide repeats
MANLDHVTRLKEGSYAWNQWRKQNPNVRPDLSEADLLGTYLRGTNLNEADLRSADFSGADLRGANLTQANLLGTNLNEAKLAGTKFTLACLGETILANLDLSRTVGLENCVHVLPSSIDYQTLAQLFLG